MENQTPTAGTPPADAPALDATHATTEAAGGHEAFPPFEAATFGTQLIWLVLCFVVLYVVVARFALPRIGGIIEDRKGRIDGDLAAADASRQETDAAIASYEAALAEARKKSHAIAEETRGGIKADIDAKRHVVEADLGKKLTEAETRIRATKTEAMGHVSDIAAETVEALVSRLTGQVSAQDVRDAVAQAAKE
ncbi:MAG TPA: ATP F0F1 synthase subunit B [Devosiaceae bacterium]|jgi:F-type H+-transporting ATPase subunit b